eukprot:1158652-Pelagomonas_calceolata.AAC.6
MAWAFRHAALAALKGCKNMGGVQEAVRGAQQPMEQVLTRMGQQTRRMGESSKRLVLSLMKD